MQVTKEMIEAGARALAELACFDPDASDNAEHYGLSKNWKVHDRQSQVVITAALSAMWQPIETAPRDGTLILVNVKHIGADAVSYWGAGWRETSNGLMLRDAPTHWMPLPPAPETK